MARDARGEDLTGTPEAVAAYDAAIDHLIRYQAEVADAASAAVAADPTCVMARVLCAYLSLMSTEGQAVARARTFLAGAPGDRATEFPRERTHLAAARSWAAGDMSATGVLLDEILVRHPRDLLALAVGHQIDFFTGDAVNLRDRVGRTLHGWQHDDPQTGYVHGMYAFGLEECNLYEQSQEFGLAAVEQNRDDVWAIHAVTHTYEMTGRIPDGLRYLREREADWQQGNFLSVHNSWHYALYLLQGGDVDGALATYDRMIHPSDAQDSAFELLDASALLWRIYLDGASAGDRWQPLATAWARVLTPGFYPFNDMHAVMAFVAGGEPERAEHLVRALEEVLDRRDQASTGWRMTQSVGLPVCRGLVHFGRGEYDKVIAELLPIRRIVHTFGGSHAQRDAIERTLLEAAIRSGRLELASALVSERLSARERNTYAWSKRSWLRAAAGDHAGAATATARASELASQIRTAAS